IDAIRSCKLALDRGIKGALYAPSAYLMKSPPEQWADDTARQRLERVIAGGEEGPVAALIGRPLRALAYPACAPPPAPGVPALALAVASVIYALSSLTFATSTRALLPPGQTYVERYTQYDHEFADLDSIAVVVEAPSLPEATLYANRLVRQLRAENVPLKQIA